MEENNEKGLRITTIYHYLQKRGLCDQIHYWGENEIIFYHWNKSMSNLIPSLVIKGNQISEIKYSREIMPVIFKYINDTIINDLNPEIHKFVRDKSNG